jgi:nitroreductase
MHLNDALRQRSSIRAFSPEPVAEETLAMVIELALQSPSWANTQPYCIALATGDLCERLRREMLEAASGSMPAGDHMLLFDYPPALQARRRTTGHGLYRTLGIERDDFSRREEQYRQNFAFFGAPAAAFLFAHDALGVYSVLDAGVFLQSLLLAAHAHGLGACAQASLASYPDVVRRHFEVPAGYRLLCGVSIGHPADQPVNHFRPGRMAVAELLLPPRQI